MDDNKTLKTPIQARQGVVGHNVRYVLFAGLALAVVAFLVIEVLVR